jgi:hypothetical protein
MAAHRTERQATTCEGAGRVGAAVHRSAMQGRARRYRLARLRVRLPTPSQCVSQSPPLRAQTMRTDLRRAASCMACGVAAPTARTDAMRRGAQLLTSAGATDAPGASSNLSPSRP